MIYLTGDIHMNIDIDPILNFSFRKDIKDDDILIITGDAGFMWNTSEYYKDWLDWFDEQRFKTMFIDGNHENHNYLDSLPILHYNDNENSKFHKLSNNVMHLMRGQIYEIEGINIFTFGGGDSIDKLKRLSNVTWWEREMPCNAEYEEGFHNLDLYKNKVDYIITHCCSTTIFNHINKIYKMKPIYTSLNHYFDMINDCTDYIKWYFGHYHIDLNISNSHRVLFDDIISIGE